MEVLLLQNILMVSIRCPWPLSLLFLFNYMHSGFRRFFIITHNLRSVLRGHSQANLVWNWFFWSNLLCSIIFRLTYFNVKTQFLYFLFIFQIFISFTIILSFILPLILFTFPIWDVGTVHDMRQITNLRIIHMIKYSHEWSC